MDLELLSQLSSTEKKSYYLAGIDEVGRGPLAGPVVCACVSICFESQEAIENLTCLLEQWQSLGVTDSKKLTTKKRLNLLKELGIDLNQLEVEKNYTLCEGKNFKVLYRIAEISHTLIDEMNILRASLLGMEKAFCGLELTGQGKILIDGNKIPEGLRGYDSEAVVKGDSRSVAIGLASIVAKEYRDLLMQRLGEIYPGYGLENHAGYPTKTHKEALVKLGVTPIHRRSFKGVKELCCE